MPESWSAFDEFRLLELAPSRWLRTWWGLLHALLGLTTLAVELDPAFVGLAALAIVWHYRVRNPVHAGLLLAGRGSRFALPWQGRFNLTLAEASAAGDFWIELYFCDRPRQPVLVLRDQLAIEDWRKLWLCVRERV